MTKYRVLYADTKEVKAEFNHIEQAQEFAYRHNMYTLNPVYVVEPVHTFDRKDLTVKDTCQHCSKDLRLVNEIHVVEGSMYCSESCAINEQTNIIIDSAKETAKQWYNNFAEVVTARDIGIIREETWTAYSPEADITTILVSAYENDKVLSTEVVGMYFGEPNEDCTELYKGSLKAIL